LQGLVVGEGFCEVVGLVIGKVVGDGVTVFCVGAMVAQGG